MGLGSEILFILVLGLLVLGPKHLHTLLGHVARAKAQFEETSRGFKSQLAAELDSTPQAEETDASDELAGDVAVQQPMSRTSNRMRRITGGVPLIQD